MNTGDFEDVLRRSNINPKYNELLEVISTVNEQVSKIEDQLDKLISEPSAPATELKIRRLMEIMHRVNSGFNDPVED